MAEISPVQIPVGILKSIALLLLLNHCVRNAVSLEAQENRSVMPGCKPAVFAEGHRSQEHFPAQMVVSEPASGLPESQMQEPPVPCVILDQIAVPDTLQLVTAQIAVGQDRILRIGFERAGRGSPRA